jgi:hypothetical protein
VGYLAAIVIVVVGSLTVLAYLYVRHELRPAPRMSPAFARAAAGRSRRVAPGDGCVCGGTVGRTGRISRRFGELLGCTGCKRSWTADGRRLIRRSRHPRQNPEAS